MPTSFKTLPGGALNQAAEYARNSWHVVVDDDVTLEDILRPAFWAHHASRLGKFALVDLIRQDGTLDVQVRVLEVGIGFAKVRVRHFAEDSERAEEMAAAAAIIEGDNAARESAPVPSEYKISTNARGGFIVTYTPTDAKIAQGLKTRAEAIAKAKEHAKQAGIAWPEPAPVENA